MAFAKLITLASCRPDAGTFVERGNQEFAVFRWTDPDRVVVTDNACPHASGNLSGDRDVIITGDVINFCER